MSAVLKNSVINRAKKIYMKVPFDISTTSLNESRYNFAQEISLKFKLKAQIYICTWLEQKSCFKKHVVVMQKDIKLGPVVSDRIVFETRIVKFVFFNIFFCAVLPYFEEKK